MRYLRLLRMYAANSIQLELEYRANFAVNGITALLSLAAGLVVLSVMFSHAESFGGWSFYEAMTLFGIFLLFEEFIYGTLTDNLSRLPELIRTGDLDFVLLKPINSQFQVSARRFSLTSLPTALLGLGVAIYGMVTLGTLTPANAALALCLLMSGAVIVYALWVMLLTLAFWFVKVENITEIFNAFFSAGRFPISAFPPWVRLILTFVVPIAFVTTVPASAAIGRLGWEMAVASLAIAALLLLASHLFWRFALASYTSASS
jgi:viologen exporter family transport system permease protein